jgi:hypothetical protein
LDEDVVVREAEKQKLVVRNSCKPACIARQQPVLLVEAKDRKYLYV